MAHTRFFGEVAGYPDDDLAIRGTDQTLKVHTTHNISSEHLRYRREHYQK